MNGGLLIYTLLEPVNMIYLEKMVFADLVRDFKMRSTWIELDPKSSDVSLLKTEENKTNTGRAT